MVVQAILDAIVDLAIPVTAAYQDAIDELELNVLTDPAIEHAKKLYILQSEIASFKANISPTNNLINALRDHKGEPGRPGHATTTVTIAPWTYTYLGDVEDHIVLITDSIDQMRRAADNMIDLIFNTIGMFTSYREGGVMEREKESY
jgi:Mg2+ and Co2+ transporter CorA